MITDTIEDIDREILEDNEFIQNLSEYVKTLPKLTDEQINEYDIKMHRLESIHNEIRLKNPSFMPIYNPLLDREESAGTKYLDMVYSLGTI